MVLNDWSAELKLFTFMIFTVNQAIILYIMSPVIDYIHSLYNRMLLFLLYSIRYYY